MTAFLQETKRDHAAVLDVVHERKRGELAVELAALRAREVRTEVARRGARADAEGGVREHEARLRAQGVPLGPGGPASQPGADPEEVARALAEEGLRAQAEDPLAFRERLAAQAAAGMDREGVRRFTGELKER